MFTQISISEVESILKRHFTMDIRLRDLIFYKSDSEDGYTIFCTNSEPIQNKFRKYAEIESFGIPIIKKEKTLVSILPPIINFISDKYASFQLEQEFLVSISFGKTIKLLKPDSYCFIINNRGDKISFGKIEDKMFVPFIDLGWYLRQGT